MSMVLEEYYEEITQGYQHCDKVICHRCIGDKALSSYIKANGTRRECSYCHKKNTSVSFDDFMGRIMEGVEFMYSRAADELPVDKGEYVGKTYTSSELVHNTIADQICPNDEAILHDIRSVMLDDVWCDADPFSDDPGDAAFYNWESFCKLVKEQVRYVFFQTNSDESSDPIKILDTIAEYADTVKLRRTIKSRDKMYRCRTSKESKRFTEPEDFAPPPVEYAHAGRMNPEGINVLYLTMDSETALAETNVTGNDYASVATIRVQESIPVLDLTRIDRIPEPSIFDIDRRHLRSLIRFLHRFVDSIAQPASTPGIDYVPTQIVTEYFRYVRREGSAKYEGILYKSAQNPGGKCLALFLTRKEFLEGKFGIHIVPSQTAFYKKEYQKQE